MTHIKTLGMYETVLNDNLISKLKINLKSYMDFLKKIRQKIDEFCFNHMRMDGAQHLIAGILIYDVLKYLIPVWSAILITLIILVAKEVVVDKWVKKGVADWHDIIWGAIGLLLGVL